MKRLTLLAMLQQLGVVPSFSRPSASDDNPYSEALFRTLKYYTRFPTNNQFKTVIDARNRCEAFTQWYNHEHLHSALKFITPLQRHTGQDILIRSKRHQIYQKARALNPARWSDSTCEWTLPNWVELNPENNNKNTENKFWEAA